MPWSVRCGAEGDGLLRLGRAASLRMTGLRGTVAVRRRDSSPSARNDKREQVFEKIFLVKVRITEVRVGITSEGSLGILESNLQ
jgi:hypothetical protein